MKKILVLFGTRPEAIKLAPVIKELKKVEMFNVFVCSTGQHREMLKPVLSLFNLKLDCDLDLMKENQDLFYISANLMIKLRDALNEIKPDLVIVQGDTTTAFIASLCAYYLKIKVAHVEAGLRSYDIMSPFPEEANRRFISTIADYHFTPTDDSADNLLHEGVTKDRIIITGNTVIDALEYIKNEVNGFDEKKIETELELPEGFFNEKYVLITLHRREKFGEEFAQLLVTLREISEKYPNYNFIYPVHMNPNVKLPVEKELSNLKNFFLISPQDYLRFSYLMRRCYFIMSDSGGIQEECFVFRKPIIVLRDVTERKEAIKAGYAFLTGSDSERIKDSFYHIDDSLSKGYDFFKGKNPFGDGLASIRIKEELQKVMK